MVVSGESTLNVLVLYGISVKLALVAYYAVWVSKNRSAPLGVEWRLGVSTGANRVIFCFSCSGKILLLVTRSCENKGWC